MDVFKRNSTIQARPRAPESAQIGSDAVRHEAIVCAESHAPESNEHHNVFAEA